jgi:hypothetical protein
VTTSIAKTTTTGVGYEDRSWLHDGLGIDHNETGTLDVSTLTKATHFPNGVFRSGSGLYQLASGMWVPAIVGGDTNEVQTVTEGGSGLTSFTLTYAGQTTGSIAAAATADDVHTALAALSNLDGDDVTVTGDAGGPFTVTFAGSLSGENIAQLTSTPTGGTGTVTVATSTGGAQGSGVRAGLLYDSVELTATTDPDVGIAVFTQGKVRLSKLPTNHGVDAAFKAAAPLIEFIP